MTDDLDARVQRKAEEHLAACQDGLYDEVFDAPSPAYAPFCGCDTCVVREVLMCAWDELLAEARREASREARPRTRARR